MEKQHKIRIDKMIIGLLALLGVFCLVASILQTFATKYPKKDCYMVFLITVIYVVVIILITSKIIPRMNEKLVQIFIYLCLISMPIVQIWIVFHMQLAPKVDLSHVINESISMLDTVTISDKKYFGFNTNNIPITIFTYWVFKCAHILGYTNYKIAGGLFNVAMLWIAFFAFYQILRRITERKSNLAVLLFAVTNPILYAYASYYYTDTVSMPFMMVSIYFFVRAYQEEKKRWTGVEYFLAGLLLCLGTQIRVTSIFAAFAYIVFLIMKNKRLILRFMIGFCLGFVIMLTAWHGIYKHYVTFDTTDSAIPAMHFIMMGSTGNGIYSYEDMKYTRSFPTKEEKVAADYERFRSRMKKNGVLGSITLGLRKESVVWGIGQRGYLQYTQYVDKETRTYAYIAGTKSQLFKDYCQSYNIILFLLISCSLIIAYRKNDIEKILLFGIHWGGGILFYIIWEAHPRHSTSFLYILMLLSIPVFQWLSDARSNNEKLK